MMMFLLRTNILVSRWGQQTKSGHLFLSDISWQRTFLSFQTTFEQQKVPVNLSLEKCFRHSDLLLLVLTIKSIFFSLIIFLCLFFPNINILYFANSSLYSNCNHCVLSLFIYPSLNFSSRPWDQEWIFIK